LYSGSANNSTPSGTAISVYNGSDASTVTVITGGFVSTGIYSATICVPSSSVATYYDVWFSGSDSVSDGASSSVQYSTGTIQPLFYGQGFSIGNPTYYLSISNLQQKYLSTDTARMNLFVRKKDWSPTIYTVANAAVESETIVSASYRVYRLMDGLEAVSYGTGSDYHTGLSYDISGNYFNLDMGLLEPGYAYGLRFAFYDSDNKTWREQDQVFKFRVEDYEY
jgi:hypothetical protein